MAIVYLALADKLELPIVGIDLPHHFILGYPDVNETGNGDFLFYINPFSKGAVFGKGELERYLQRMIVETDPCEMKASDNIRTIRRLLSDISSNYERSGEHRKLGEIDSLLLILDNGD